MAKKTSTPEEIRQLEIYHSTLIVIEQILSSSNSPSIEEVEKNIKTAQNFFKQTQKRNPLTKEQTSNIEKTFSGTSNWIKVFKNKPKYVQEQCIAKFKALRKPIDKEYIKNLLFSTSAPKPLRCLKA